ncbi:MAG: extracellular solute-binding protein [Clostridia bacterium]|nr:extracellular solute-binding protein [Clostridia bacterium]
MKKKLSVALCVSFLLCAFPFSGCNHSSSSFQNNNDDVLRVASWDEYIDEGGEDSYAEGSRPLYEEFEDWYFQTTGKKIKVEYVTLQDNETMYNKIKMGDHYDLLCPSEYMMMKMAAEDRLQKLPDSFFDPSIETNYYVQNLSPYIKEVFENGKLSDGTPWSDYIAGYMWGSTGFVFDPEKIDREIMTSWNALSNEACKRKITAKDNVRDSYFMGLGMHYENELLAYKQRFESGEVSRENYKAFLADKMNDTSEETMNAVKKRLETMRGNLYGLETDEGKLDVASGRLASSYQWSGDAVYILDLAEENDIYLEYSIPSSASNLWFDGWVMMKGANVDAATAFINFLSIPENVIRNMYYIGYTSCIGGDDVFAYVEETYAADEDETDVEEYPLSYFFGEGYTLQVASEQTRRQLFAQYPDQNTIDRLVVMKYFDKKTNERANRMWNNIK